MKKAILGLVVAVAAFSVRAEYLYWAVTSTEGWTKGSAENWNAAVLYATTSTRSDSPYPLQTAAKAEAQAGVNTNLGDWSGADYSYYIELINNSADSVAYTSQTFTYAQLSGALNDGLATSLQSMMVFTGTAVVGTPEPTSGVLLLMGFAMLGLKRKKEV